jgi:hypothetical protein
MAGTSPAMTVSSVIASERVSRTRALVIARRQRRSNPSFVIASEAKQSMEQEMDAASLSLRAMTR